MENEEQLNSELEEMRAQIALLKSKLNQETIITEKLMRDTIKRKAKSINTNAWISIGSSVFVIVWALVYMPAFGFSWWLIGATILMMLVCDLFTWKKHKNINNKTINGDLVTVAIIMRDLKKAYQNWIKYGISMVVVWFIWLAIEYCIILNDWRLALCVILSLSLGAAIGGVIGMRMHKSVVNNATDILQQIEDE